MTPEELGAILKTERERRGIDIADVAEKLRISARIIRALEAGDYSAMPHSVYVRGFIRSYASFLGLDVEEFSQLVNSLHQEEVSNVQASPYTDEAESAADGGNKFFVILSVLVCLGGIGVFVMYSDVDVLSELNKAVISASSKPATSSAKPAPAAVSRSAAKPDGAVSSGRIGMPSNTLDPAGKSADKPTPPISVKASESPPKPAVADKPPVLAQAAVPLPAPPASTVAEPRRPAPDEGGGEQAQPAVDGAAPPPGKHQIIITAQAECWIHSNADNADTRQFSLRKGDTFALTFTNKLVIKLGNAGGVRIRYDGREIPPPGVMGQVRTITFPPAP